MLNENKKDSDGNTSPERIPLVLFSGGLDSTLLAFKELQCGDIDLLSVNLLNTFQHHIDAEKQARGRILNKFAELHRRGILRGAVREHLEVDFEYPTAPSKVENVRRLGQQQAWLFTAFVNHDPLKHSTVLHGMLMNDTLVISVDALKIHGRLYVKQSLLFLRSVIMNHGLLLR